MASSSSLTLSQAILSRSAIPRHGSAVSLPAFTGIKSTNLNSTSFSTSRRNAAVTRLPVAASVLDKVLHMNSGSGETSYANNSGLQKSVISETLPLLDETLKEMFQDKFPKCFKMADFGCSSGPNTLFVISHVMDTLKDLCQSKNFETPIEFQFFLNDLPSNDFNNLFSLLDETESGRSRCFISGSPGSFYTRLFPSNSLHFAYSSASLQWLSQVPEGLEKKNKENIYLDPTSPPEVFEAYSNQYQRDFFTFLRFRGEEIIPGGRMVLIFVGRNPSSTNNYENFTLLARTLLDMVGEGLIKKDDLYSFNIPVYSACQQEVEQIVTREGSFNLDKIKAFRMPWDANDEGTKDLFDENRTAKFAAATVRAFMEPMLTSHFGRSINYDNLFERYEQKLAQHKSVEETSYCTMLVSLSRN